MKLYENILNDFEVTERTRVCGKNLQFFNVQTAITQEECKPELRFLRSARLFIFLNICVNLSQTVYELRSGQGFDTDANGKNNMSPSPFGVEDERHNNF